MNLIALCLWCAAEAIPPDLHEVLWRFPTADCARHQVTFAKKHVDWVHQRRDDFLRDYGPECPHAWGDWCWEAERLWRVWDALAGVWDVSRPLTERRGELRNLYHRTTWPEWIFGLMPPAVPWWRFTEKN